MQPNERVLVVGATSSLAQALCRALAGRGLAFVLAGRDEIELELLADDLAARYGADCRLLIADVAQSGFSAVDFIEGAGDFDHVVIALGDMGADDKDDPANIATVTHINYTVPAQLATQAGISLTNKQRGVIALISSVAGDRGRQSNYVYGAAKAALNAFASGLRNRLYRQGVCVLTVKPGFTDTPMTWGMNSPLMASRETVAEKIARAMDKKRDVVYVPWFWRYIMLIIVHIPERVFKRLSL